jgi:hypothetical protein
MCFSHERLHERKAHKKNLQKSVKKEFGQKSQISTSGFHIGGILLLYFAILTWKVQFFLKKTVSLVKNTFKKISSVKAA